MNPYTVYNLKLDVDSNLHAGGVSQLQNFYNTIEKGRRALISKVRPEELIRKSYLEDALFPDVTRYAAPSDLKYHDLIDLKLLHDYRNVDTMDHPATLVYSRRFAQKRGGSANVMSVAYENGVKYVSVFNPRGMRNCVHRVIHNCNSLTDNGTWNVGGNVVNLTTDELNFVQKKASLKFDINDSATTGFLANYSIEAVDLEEFMKKGATFLWVNVPLPKNLTSVKLVLGSDTSNIATDYFYNTVNQPHDNNEFTADWNLLKYMMMNLNQVGTPNPKSITWLRIEFTTTGQPIPGCNIDNIVTRKGAVYEVRYNGSYILMDPQTKTFKKYATQDSDIVVAEEDTYNMLMLEVTLAAQKEIYGANAGARSDVDDIQADLDKAYKTYKMEHKSEAILDSDSVHVFGNQYDGYTDDPMAGFGNQYGQYGDYGSNQ